VEFTVLGIVTEVATEGTTAHRVSRNDQNHVRIAAMRIALTFAPVLLSALLAVPSVAADEPTVAPIISCGSSIPGGVNCVLSKKELKQAREIFARGVKLEEQNRIEEAFTQFDEASRMVPRNVQYLSARELSKAKIVFDHVERGNDLLAENSPAQAAIEFRAALDLDPDNTFARERLEEATREQASASPAPPTGVMAYKLEDTGEIHIQPKNDRATFHYRGDVRGLFNELATAYGITTQFDDSVQTRQVRFYVDDVDFFTALRLACRVSKTMWSALDTHQLLIAADTTENHKQFDRMSLRTFILPAHSTPQEVTDMVTTLRNMFELRSISTGQTNDTLEIRAPQPVIEACGKLLEQLGNKHPQVLFDVRVFQISHDLTRNIGLHIPDTFNLYNIPAAALVAALGSGTNIQSLINQLISSGGINQAGTSALSGLLAQLGGQNSIFSQPLATFGGGLTLMGLTLDQFTAALSVNESWARSLSDMQLRAGQGQDATFHLGERYPIMNASYAPIYNSSQISQVLGNQSYVPPFPSVSYEDLGLSVKVKPTVHRNGDVSVNIELQVRSLSGDSANGIPVISNREYKGSINLKDGEPAVLAGQISKSDTLSMSGVPWLGVVPGLNQIMATNTKEEEDDELMIVMTPHVVANIDPHESEIWLSER
jgi:general secretion pathway protein D